jgi:ABC-type nitrate/sulfonate/bicarbonate transport system substrate-binding protein
MILPAIAMWMALAAGTASAGEATKLRVGLSPYPDLMPVSIGAEKGWYREEGLDLDIKYLEWGETIEALAGGSVDITNACDVDVLTKLDNFPDIVFSNVVFYSAGSGVLVRPNSGLKTFQEFTAELGDRAKAIKATGEQLRGKTAIAAHNTDHELTIFILAQRGGVDPVKEMKWIDMTPPEGLAAFLTGTGDLYNGGIPQRLKGVEEGNKLLVTLKDLKPEGINFCGFATTKKFAEEHMDLLTAFQRVAYRNHQFIEQRPDEGFDIMRKTIKKVAGDDIAIDRFKYIWKELEFFPTSDAQLQKELLSPNGDFYWRPRFELIDKFYHDAKLIKAPISLDQIAVFVQMQDAYSKRYGEK